MAGPGAGESGRGWAREDSEASPLVTAEGRADELMRPVSLEVRKPFRADRRGLLAASGHATLGAGPPARTGGAGLDAPWDVGVRGKGRPANTEDSEAEFGLLAAAAVEAAVKGRPGKEAEAKVSLAAGAARGAAAAGAWGAGAPGGGTRPGNTAAPGAAVVLWPEVTGAAGKEAVLMTVGLGAAGWAV